MVEKGAELPADILLLKTSNADGICHVQTANLDGETSTKIYNAIKKTFQMSDNEVIKVNGVIKSLTNCYILNSWEANVTLGSDAHPIPLDYHNLLLRGSRLVLTDYVIGVAVFCGSDTKLALNLPKPSHKFSKLDRIMNVIVLVSSIKFLR